MPNIIPSMRLVRDDGTVVIPAVEQGKLQLLEIPHDNLIHEQMHNQNKFSRIVFEEENQGINENDFSRLADTEENFNQSQDGQDIEELIESRKNDMQILQSEVTEEQLNQTQLIDRVAAGRILVHIGSRLIQSSHYDIGEIKQIEAEVTKAFNILKNTEL